LFTGIIEEVGRVRSLRRQAESAVLGIEARSVGAELKPGDSIAVNGACLTVTDRKGDGLSCDLSPETLQRTTLGEARRGMAVNLERPLSLGSRLGGHFVQGHIDGIGRLISRAPGGDGSVVTIEYPAELERYFVYKGSVAVDGISLTIAALKGNAFTVAVIPFTMKTTNLGSLQVGSAVNLEVDILGKYVERFFQSGLASDKPSGLSAAYLKEQGF
jgi:riboflavin synthase